MILGPWLIWVPLLAFVNLMIFVAIRGRWGRIVHALALAAVIGVMVGDRIGDATGLEVVRIGDMHVLAASVVAQLLMLAVTLLSALGPIEIKE